MQLAVEHLLKNKLTGQKMILKNHHSFRTSLQRRILLLVQALLFQRLTMMLSLRLLRLLLVLSLLQVLALTFRKQMDKWLSVQLVVVHLLRYSLTGMNQILLRRHTFRISQLFLQITSLSLMTEKDTTLVRISTVRIML